MKKIPRKEIRILVGNHFTAKDENYAFISIVRKISDVKIGICFRFFWFITLLFSVITCAILLYDRFTYYLSEPSIVNVQTTQNNIEMFPSIVLCSSISPSFSEYADKVDNGAPAQILSCIMPMQKYTQNSNITSNELWSLLDSSEVIDDVYMLQNPRKSLKHMLKPVKTTDGTCIELTLDEEIELANPKMKLVYKIDQDKIGKRCPFSLIKMGLMQRSDFRIALPLIFEAQDLITTQVVFQRYTFLQKTRKTCSTVEEYNLCEYDCSIRQLKTLNLTCKLPFMPEHYNLPVCEGSYVDNYMRSLEVYFGVWKARPETAVSCDCLTPCNRDVILILRFTNDVTGSTITLGLTDTIRHAKEIAAYGSISLLCDLGGNIGLCLGVSVLMIAEMIVVLIQLIARRKEKKKKRLYELYIESTVDKCLKKYTPDEQDLGSNFQLAGLKYILNKDRNSTTKKAIWVFLVTFSCFVCAYQIYDRIDYYFYYPKAVSIEMIALKDIDIPSTVFCLESTKLLSIKTKFMKKNQIPGCPDQLDMLELIDEKTTAESLWLTSIRPEPFSLLRDHETSKSRPVPITAVKYPTVFGICTRLITKGSVKYYPRMLGYSITSFKKRECLATTRIFQMPVGNFFNLNTYIQIYYSGTYGILYTSTKLIRLDTPTSRCIDKKDHVKCVERCFDERITRNITSCKLPFMNSTLETCKTPKSAKQVKLQYISIMTKTDPIKDCKCIVPCNDTIYNYMMQVLMDFGSPANQFFVTVTHNLQEIIKESNSFPFVKLLCDIGSNMGVVIGMSVVSLFHDILQVVQITRKT